MAIYSLTDTNCTGPEIQAMVRVSQRAQFWDPMIRESPLQLARQAVVIRRGQARMPRLERFHDFQAFTGHTANPAEEAPTQTNERSASRW